jgi:hypothetical protein
MSQEEIVVMKKAGLMVATTAGLMLAASPLAFAGTGHDGGHGDGGHGSHGGDHGNGGHGDGGHGDNGHGDGGHGTPQRTVQAQNGLVNVQDVADLNANACNANVLSNVLGLLGNQIAGASGSCEITDAGGDGVQLQNGLVNVQDLADLNLNACNANVLSNVGAVLGSQVAGAKGHCEVTDR